MHSHDTGLVHYGCLLMDLDVLVLGPSTIVRGAIATIPWYNPFVRSGGRREIFYHNYEVMIINTLPKQFIEIPAVVNDDGHVLLDA